MSEISLYLILIERSTQGRTWHSSAGASIGVSGSSPINVNTAGIIVDPLNADHGLMNQESQVVDSSGQIHAIISYVPGMSFFESLTTS